MNRKSAGPLSKGHSQPLSTPKRAANFTRTRSPLLRRVIGGGIFLLLAVLGMAGANAQTNVLINGGDNPGTITADGDGATNFWTLTADAGDNVVLRLGTTNFTGFISVYGPDGTLLTDGAGADVPISFTATNDGVFTALVQSFGFGGAGDYTLRLAEMPEPFGVPAIPLINGGANPGTLSVAGLDIWTLTANAGDNIDLRLGTTNFTGFLTVYGPDGSQLTDGAGDDIPISITATNAGAFTVLVSCFGSGGSGAYTLRLAQMPEPFIVPAKTLVNGGKNPGTLVLGGLDIWTLTANAGDNIALRLGTTNFTGFLNVYAPDGSQLTDGAGTDIPISFTAASHGAYTVVVSDFGADGTGGYNLNLAQLPEPFAVPGTALVNGGDNLGNLGLGALDIWTLTANPGDNVVLRLGTTNFVASLNVYGPDGALLTTGAGNDVAASFTATNSGTFTALVGSFGGNGVGAYGLRLAEMPEPFIVPATPLINGAVNPGTLGLGGLDIWTFTANPGDNVTLRVGTTNFLAFLNVYGPDGALLTSTAGTNVSGSFTATNSGAFTAIISSYGANGVGAYGLSFLQSSQPLNVPAMPLINGGANPGTLGLGGLDIWGFTANAGDNILLRLATTNFFAYLNVYGPDGALLFNAAGPDVAGSFTATNSGAFTAIVSVYGSDPGGAYTLRLAEMPEPFIVPAMPLISGGENPGTLDFGGLDIWTFSTSAGNNLVLQLDTTNFYGFLGLYGPDGTQLNLAFGNAAQISYTTTNGGAFTAIVDSFGGGGSGAYLLYLGGVPPPAAPTVTTLAVVIQTANLETLNALVTPNGEPTQVYFQWGTDTNYGNLTATEALADNLYVAQNVGLNISNFAPGILHYRAVATNSLGTNYGADATFTNNAALTAGTYVFTRSSGLPARISIQSLLSAAVHDGSGLPDSLASVGASTNGSSISFNSTFILFSATNNLPESFGYTVTNTAGNSAQGLIQVNVSQPVSGFNLSPTLNPDGSATIVSHGIPGVSYVIQRSTDLSHWSDVSAVTADANGLLQFTDPLPPTPAAYYRMRQN